MSRARRRQSHFAWLEQHRAQSGRARPLAKDGFWGKLILDMTTVKRQPEQLSLAEELQPLLPAQHERPGARRRGAGAHPLRSGTIWAHEATLPTVTSTSYTPVLRRDPEWVAKTLDAAQRGVILLSLDAVNTLAALLDDQFVFEAHTMVDLENGIAITLQEKRRQGLAMARRAQPEAEELHIPLCPSIRDALTNPQTSQWLLTELAVALQGELMPAIGHIERLRELMRLQEARREATAHGACS
jgi:hypothetical protein